MDELSFSIGSDCVAGRAAEERILDLVHKAQFGDAAEFAIRVALAEALINAIKHGNAFDPSKQIHIRARVSPEQAEIIIEDEGQGFDRRAVPDPTSRQGRCRLHGRGILLMESYMDQVQWSLGGRRVRMVKRNR